MIQKCLRSYTRRTAEDSARSFAKLIWQGKINSALKMLTTDYENGVLQLDENILEDLKSKHPATTLVKQDSLLFGPTNQLPQGYFDDIDEIMVGKAASYTKGSGGPSHVDADQFRHILLSKNFKKEAKELREQIALLVRTLASTLVDPNSIDALTCCRLIPLNKNPGVRPIGVGEVMRRVIGKTINWILTEDIQEAAGPLQTATGLKAGAEAAIRSMRLIFEDPSTEAIILVDASNAFNSLNRKVVLHNIQITCHSFSYFLINTYRNPPRMIILGGAETQSTEGTTQGDNLAMSFYAIGTVQIQHLLRLSASDVKQVWLTDDATGAGSVDSLKKWWDDIIDQGNRFGYYVNQKKSWIILKDANLFQKATVCSMALE